MYNYRGTAFLPLTPNLISLYLSPSLSLSLSLPLSLPLSLSLSLSPSLSPSSLPLLHSRLSLPAAEADIKADNPQSPLHQGAKHLANMVQCVYDGAADPTAQEAGRHFSHPPVDSPPHELCDACR